MKPKPPVLEINNQKQRRASAGIRSPGKRSNQKQRRQRRHSFPRRQPTPLSTCVHAYVRTRPGPLDYNLFRIPSHGKVKVSTRPKSWPRRHGRGGRDGCIRTNGTFTTVLTPRQTFETGERAAFLHAWVEPQPSVAVHVMASGMLHVRRRPRTHSHLPSFRSRCWPPPPFRFSLFPPTLLSPLVSTKAKIAPVRAPLRLLLRLVGLPAIVSSIGRPD